jgi:outer membrane lipoprotein-sorting protein
MNYCELKRMPKIFLFYLLLIPVGGFAQPAGFTQVKDVANFKKEFAAQNVKLTSIKSAFTQEKTLTLLTEKIVSKGQFYFKRSDKIRIEYTEPYTYLLIINGDQMISKDAKKESHVNTSSNKLFRQVNRIIVDCVQGTVLTSKDFSVNVFENTSTFLLQMTPQSKTIKEFFETIYITLDKQDYTVSGIELNEQGGDKTVMRFTNKQLNTNIGDEVFTLH